MSREILLDPVCGSDVFLQEFTHTHESSCTWDTNNARPFRGDITRDIDFNIEIGYIFRMFFYSAFAIDPLDFSFCFLVGALVNVVVPTKRMKCFGFVRLFMKRRQIWSGFV